MWPRRKDGCEVYFIKKQPKESYMTKEEALKKIEELKEFIEKSERPELRAGQVWRNLTDGDLYLAINDYCSEGMNNGYTLVSTERPGAVWSYDTHPDMRVFEYVGDAKSVKVDFK
jgi:hypothetical protein